MKKRLAFEAFLTWVTEGIIPDLKNRISNILTLKSKTVTLLLGTFIPLFFSHAVVYSVYPEITWGPISIYSKIGKYPSYFFILLLAFLCECAFWYCLYLAIFNNVAVTMDLSSRVLFISTVALLIFCGKILVIKIAYDALLKSRRKTS